jgi:hypothetical protein
MDGVTVRYQMGKRIWKALLIYPLLTGSAVGQSNIGPSGCSEPQTFPKYRDYCPEYGTKGCDARCHNECHGRFMRDHAAVSKHNRDRHTCIETARVGGSHRELLSNEVLESLITNSKPELLDSRDQQLLSSLRMKGATALLGVRSVLSSLVVSDAQKVMQLVSSSERKANIMQDIVQRSGLIQELCLRFKKEAADGTLTPEKRKRFEEWIGDLLNRNDHRLHLEFGAEIYKPGYLDGTVRARHLLARLERGTNSETGRAMTNRLADLIRASDSQYKSFTLEQFEALKRSRWETKR